MPFCCDIPCHDDDRLPFELQMSPLNLVFYNIGIAVIIMSLPRNKNLKTEVGTKD